MKEGINKIMNLTRHFDVSFQFDPSFYRLSPTYFYKINMLKIKVSMMFPVHLNQEKALKADFYIELKLITIIAWRLEKNVTKIKL